MLAQIHNRNSLLLRPLLLYCLLPLSDKVAQVNCPANAVPEQMFHYIKVFAVAICLKDDMTVNMKNSLCILNCNCTVVDSHFVDRIFYKLKYHFAISRLMKRHKSLQRTSESEQLILLEV